MATATLSRRIKKNFKTFDDYLNYINENECVPEVNLERFLKGKEFPAKAEGYSIINEEFVEKNGLIYYWSEFSCERDYVSAIIINGQLVKNGDETGDNEDIYGNGFFLNERDNDKLIQKSPTLSLKCFGQFFSLGADSGAKLLVKAFKVVDFTLDEKKSLTKSEQTLLDKGQCPKNKEGGWTLVYGKWHRSGTVLIRDTRKNGKSYILGQDDGSYFGCELVGHPKTVEAAFEALQPKEAKGQKFYRQGEWFFIEVKEEKIDTLGMNIKDGNIVLPLEDEESNTHTITCVHACIIDKNIWVKNPTITHNQHPKLLLVGWYLVKKNLAVRSVSQDGVD